MKLCGGRSPEKELLLAFYRIQPTKRTLSVDVVRSPPKNKIDAIRLDDLLTSVKESISHIRFMQVNPHPVADFNSFPSRAFSFPGQHSRDRPRSSLSRSRLRKSHLFNGRQAERPSSFPLFRSDSEEARAVRSSERESGGEASIQIFRLITHSPLFSEAAAELVR